MDQTLDHGIAAFASILKRPCSLEEAIRDGEKLLRRAAEDAMRMLAVGLRLSRHPAHGGAEAFRAGLRGVVAA